MTNSRIFHAVNLVYDLIDNTLTTFIPIQKVRQKIRFQISMYSCIRFLKEWFVLLPINIGQIVHNFIYTTKLHHTIMGKSLCLIAQCFSRLLIPRQLFIFNSSLLMMYQKYTYLIQTQYKSVTRIKSLGTN